jgi:hypothetical protein
LLTKYKETSKNISQRERIVNLLRENDMLVEPKDEWVELISNKNSNISILAYTCSTRSGILINPKGVLIKMYQKAKIVIGILLLGLLVSFIAYYYYAQDLNSKLINSAMQGNTTTVKVLLVIDANVNAKNEEGKTALIYAADGGHTETVS